MRAMLERILAWVLVVICSLIFTGCGAPQQTASKSGPVLYTVTDETGTRLSFTEKPQRIISMNVSIDEILLGLVDCKRIAALSYMADDKGICSAGDAVMAVKGRVQGSNLEGVLAYQPDLVLVPVYDSNTINGLRSAGIKVYVASTPSDLAGIYKLIQQLGDAVGEHQAGIAMAAKLRGALEAMRSKVTAAVPSDKRLKVLALSFTGPLGMKGTFSDLCYYAGLKNSLAGIDVPYQGNLSEEKMLELNPDMIITPSWDYSKKGDPEQFRNKIVHNPLYKNLNAVRNNKVVRLHDNYLYSTSQYTIKAVEELAQAAYPELF